MNASDNTIIEQICRLANAEADIALLWLYGSRAKKQERSDSDYDIAVAFNDFSGDALERRLRPEVLAITWASHIGVESSLISVVDINLAPIPLAGEVVGTGELLINKAPLRAYREENRISSMIELDWNYHRKHYG